MMYDVCSLRYAGQDNRGVLAKQNTCVTRRGIAHAFVALGSELKILYGSSRVPDWQRVVASILSATRYQSP
jgi:hypothetical protein